MTGSSCAIFFDWIPISCGIGMSLVYWFAPRPHTAREKASAAFLYGIALFIYDLLANCGALPTVSCRGADLCTMARLVKTLIIGMGGALIHARVPVKDKMNVLGIMYLCPLVTWWYRKGFSCNQPSKPGILDSFWAWGRDPSGYANSCSAGIVAALDGIIGGILVLLFPVWFKFKDTEQSTTNPAVQVLAPAPAQPQPQPPLV